MRRRGAPRVPRVVVFFVGVVAFLLSAAWALIEHVRQSQTGFEFPVAFAGAVIQSMGQVWDVYGHMHLSHGGPVAWITILVGPVVAAAALLVARRTSHERLHT